MGVDGSLYLGTGVVVNTRLLSSQSKRLFENEIEIESDTVPFTYDGYGDLTNQLIIFWECEPTRLPNANRRPLIITEAKQHLLTQDNLNSQELWNDSYNRLFVCLDDDINGLYENVLLKVNRQWKPILRERHACFPGQWLVYNLS